MVLIRYQPFDGSLRATALTLPGTAWQIWDTYTIGMTARSFRAVIWYIPQQGDHEQWYKTNGYISVVTFTMLI